MPAIPLLFLGKKGFILPVLGILFAISIFNALARYFTFNYRIEKGELIISQGILERTERHIPLERVQEIQIEQNVLQRLLGVVNAKVETAGGSGPEASLSVLSKAEAERLRKAVFDTAAYSKTLEDKISVQVEEERTVICRLGLRDLILLGVTSNHIVSALIFLGTLYALVDDILPVSVYRQIEVSIRSAVKTFLSQDAQTTLIITIVGGVLVLVMSMIFSIVGSIVIFYDFIFSRSGEDLHRSYGLLTRRSSSLPSHRIQVIEIEEGFLRRIFKLASLKAITVAGRSGEEGNDRTQGVLLPIILRNRVNTLLPTLFPGLELEVEDWRQVSRLAVSRDTFKGGLFCVLIAAASFFYYGNPIGLWPLAFLPIIYGINLARYKKLGYMLGERYFQTRRGWLGVSTQIVPIRKAQVVEVRQTLFDRRLGLASLIVDTAGQSSFGNGPRIGNIPVEEAHKIASIIAKRSV